MKIREARFVMSVNRAVDLPAPAFAEIAFAGRSNVGKSSLINALLQRRKLVRTSSTPGCTRGIGIFRVELAEPEAVLDLVDLPGYGFARRSKAERRSWAGLIEDFLGTRAGLRGVVVICDIRRGYEEDDLALVELLGARRHEAILVATKLDKISATKRGAALAAASRSGGRPVRGFSATTGAGRDALWDTLLSVAGIAAPLSA